MVLCARWLTVQLEWKYFKPGSFLFPLYKQLMPLVIWAIDLVVHLKDAGQWEILTV